MYALLSMMTLPIGYFDHHNIVIFTLLVNTKNTSLTHFFNYYKNHVYLFKFKYLNTF